jgi:hypothetical protein
MWHSVKFFDGIQTEVPNEYYGSLQVLLMTLFEMDRVFLETEVEEVPPI